jgi:hypothetical protein
MKYVNLVRANWKGLAYIVGTAVLVCTLVWATTLKPKMPAEIKNTIDSLTKANQTLAERQRELDEIISKHELEIQGLDHKLGNIKEKQTIIREYYHEVSTQANNYSSAQVDSFFRARYEY